MTWIWPLVTFFNFFFCRGQEEFVLELLLHLVRPIFTVTLYSTPVVSCRETPAALHDQVCLCVSSSCACTPTPQCLSPQDSRASDETPGATVLLPRAPHHQMWLPFPSSPDEAPGHSLRGLANPFSHLAQTLNRARVSPVSFHFCHKGGDSKLGCLATTGHSQVGPRWSS